MAQPRSCEPDSNRSSTSRVPRLTLLTVPHGGKGAAVRTGILAAAGDLVIFADADMATPPDQIPLLVAALDDHDVALGSRIQPDGSDMRRSQPGYRRLLGQVFHVFASVVGHGSRSRHPVRVQGLHQERPRRICSGSSS